eukprot:scaffold7989_cov107-Isochrysis_galbana.AAC.4
MRRPTPEQARAATAWSSGDERGFPFLDDAPSDTGIVKNAKAICKKVVSHKQHACLLPRLPPLPSCDDPVA